MKNRLSVVFLVLLFLGLYVASKIWPGKTDAQREKDREAEFQALHEAESTCEREFPGEFYGDDEHYGTEDFKDCVAFRMRIYHRHKKLVDDALGKLGQSEKEKAATAK
jgi:hypothetical protein